ncbi:MAG: endonuclease III [Clostridia bacterium]|nr:endonuclease III [Clostridia bacterium]
MDKLTADKIIEILSEKFPDPRPELHYKTPYELLVAVILSAQCTDRRVNMVTAELFKEYSTPEKMLTLTKEQLGEKIHSCGFFNSKAEHILSASKDIVSRFGGKVPSTTEELKTLAGVGQKTANVVYAVAFGGDAIAVDTHVFRVSNRTGIAKGKTPAEVEKGLNAVLDKNAWSKAHHYLIFHGRYTCKAQKPRCAECEIAAYCEYFNKNRPISD